MSDANKTPPKKTKTNKVVDGVDHGSAAGILGGFHQYIMHIATAIFAIGVTIFIIWASFDTLFMGSSSQKVVARLKQELATQKIVVEEMQTTLTDIKQATQNYVQTSEMLQKLSKDLKSLEDKFQTIGALKPQANSTPSPDKKQAAPVEKPAPKKDISPESLKENLINRLDHGEKFILELDAFMDVEADKSTQDILKKMRPFSNRDIKTQSTLTQDLMKIHMDLEDAFSDDESKKPVPKENLGFFGNMWNSFKKNIRISKQTIKLDEDSKKVLKTAIQSLNHGHLEQSIDILDKMADPQKTNFINWIKDAKLRNDLNKLITELKLKVC